MLAQPDVNVTETGLTLYPFRRERIAADLAFCKQKSDLYPQAKSEYAGSWLSGRDDKMV